MKNTGTNNVPTVRDWHALDLICYSWRDASICPLCSSPKSNRNLLCDDCYQQYGGEGSRVVLMEIGKRNLGKWYSLTGVNLRGDGESLFDTAFGKTGAGEEMEGRRAGIPAKPGELSSHISGKRHRGQSRQYEIANGLFVHEDIMQTIAHGGKQDQIICPICRGWKNWSQWVCSNCFSEFGSRAIVAVKKETALLNPEKQRILDFHNRISEELFEEVVDKAVQMLSSEIAELFPHTPRRLANVIENIRGVPAYVNHRVLVKAAAIAIERVAEIEQEKECLRWVEQAVHWEQIALMSDEELIHRLLYENKAEFPLELLAKVIGDKKSQLAN